LDISYTITNLLSIVVPGIIAGFFAGKFMEGRSFSVLVNLFIGIAGAFLGEWLFGMLGFPFSNSLVDALLIAFLGATLLFFLTSFVRKT